MSVQPLIRLAEAAERKRDLRSLGFSDEVVKSNPESQRLLEKRSWNLKTHQITGLTTLGLMEATTVMGEQARKNNIHQYLGGVTAVGYWTTFYLANTAPNPSTETQGTNIRIHKALQWVHAPLMILTPIAGIQAHRQIRKGEPESGLAKMKGALGVATFATYLISSSIMFFEF